MRMQPGGIAALLFAVVTGSACATAAEESSIPDPDPLLVEVGAGLFATYCASCHGVDARGDGPAASALSPPPADLTRIAAREGGVFPESAIAKKIDGRFDLPAHGSREMPIWGARLGDEIPGFATGDEVARGRVASLVEYLKSLQME
jgi:mono/diheme cytochrome c family protein